MVSTPMEIDEPPSFVPAYGSLLLRNQAQQPTQTKISDVIGNYRPTKRFPREDIKEGKPRPCILSVDFDDTGDYCMTSESDATIQIYNVREARNDKKLLSQKYGVKLAKFTHSSSCIIYASTMKNNAIRYLTSHDNSFIRYFEGHERCVTSLAIRPGHDDFISCGQDDSVILWNLNTKNWTARFQSYRAQLGAWDPSGMVFGIASTAAANVLLYDIRNYTKGPFTHYDVFRSRGPAEAEACFRGWTVLEFSNDGKHILIGSKSDGHFLLDAFNGSLKAYLRKPVPGTRRLAAGEKDGGRLESSGECCFTSDGRYVIGGCRQHLLVWDMLGTPDASKALYPAYKIDTDAGREAAVVAFNPRYNMLATADEELVFWIPDPHA